MFEFTGFPSIARLRRDCVISEKIDGCVTATASITMADGSKKKIKDVVVGDVVLGQDESGALVPSAVLNTFRNGTTKDWLTVRGHRLSMGRGPSTTSVRVTANHRFYVEGTGYVRADKLVPGVHKIRTHHSDLALTAVQRSVLLGILLGDGSISTAASGSQSLAWSHSVDQLDYLEWTVAALGSLSHIDKCIRTSGYGSEMHSARTVFHPGINEVFDGFDKPAGTIPYTTVEMFNPIVLAYWYMDDGSLVHDHGQEDRVTLSTHSFSDESHKILRAALYKLGIDSAVQETSKGSFLRINANSADLMFCMIAPYLPPSMQYKLPAYYRGSTGWLPTSTEGNYRTVTADIDILSVEPWVPRAAYQKYDVETETHNYFVGSVLTHNSNACVVFEQEEGSEFYSFAVQSRKRFITPDSDNFGFAKWAYDNETALWNTLGPGRHYGEWWGSGIQRGYGLTKGERRFSLFNTARWKDVDFSAVQGLGVVPELFVGEFSTENIDQAKAALLEFGSVASPGFDRPEGIVVYHTASKSLYKVTYGPEDSYEWGPNPSKGV